MQLRILNNQMNGVCACQRENKTKIQKISYSVYAHA